MLACLLFFGSLPLCLAQSPEQADQIQAIDLKRQRYNKQGMLILGSWAIGNMAWGASQLGSSSGRVRGFHEMNIGWNAVNLAIAGVGYYSASRAVEGGSLLLSLQEQHSIEKVLLVNAALDVGYMVGGLYLIERGQRRDQPRLHGWGSRSYCRVPSCLALTLSSISFTVQTPKPLSAPRKGASGRRTSGPPLGILEDSLGKKFK
ncbi:hypothetical protein A3SI_10564 [Nitritalea halalkaliphila LW7]|uniref:Uncharacterized protein n=1 Tax=Nitritalea halalkaliphila LW7 TaxID=1189621 RepID=I5C3P3_9BACT|nr:hypothetical protein [Nitritalea halalkaliphila]EIM76445.1 hypothetical protein A3SI_10564 [Nitritalea halalkaliphila LW7]